MTQTTDILRHLKSGKRITPMYALMQFGCFRLAARIADLRASGHCIITDRIETDSGARVAEYRMGKRHA